jgi:hypothetical protein
MGKRTLCRRLNVKLLHLSNNTRPILDNRCILFCWDCTLSDGSLVMATVTRNNIERAKRRRDERLVDRFRTVREIIEWWEKKGHRYFLTEPEWVDKAREVLTRNVPI